MLPLVASISASEQGRFLQRSRYSLFFFLRIGVLVSLLAAVIAGWSYVQELGGPTKILGELLRVHNQREAASDAATARRISEAAKTLSPFSLSTVSARSAAARSLAEEGLARKKTYVSSGLSVSYGEIGAQMRIANTDNTDLYEAAGPLVVTLKADSERLRLEAGYALSHLQLDSRHHALVHDIQRALDKEYSVPIKIYLARTLGNIGTAAASASKVISELLDEDEPMLIAAAARALARMGPAAYELSTEARLLGLVSHPDAGVRDHSAEALGAIGSLTGETEAALRDALGDNDVYVRVTAGLALSDLGLTDEQIVEVLDDSYALPPRTTIYVEDVARVVEIRERVTAVFTGLGRAPEPLIPSLMAMAKEARDLEHREKAIAMIAGTDGYSEPRARALIELLKDRKVGVYYAVIDGLTGMGTQVEPLVSPLLEHENSQVRGLAQEVLTKLRPPKKEKTPIDPELPAHYLAATDSYTRQEIAATMAKTGDPRFLDFLLEHADDRVLNGRLLDVVINRLIGDLRHYKFQPTEDLDDRRAALKSLTHLDVLSESQHESFVADIENPDLGDQISQLWRAQKPPVKRPPSKKELRQQIYAGLPEPRHKAVATYAKQLMGEDRSGCLSALSGLKRIAGEAIEAPTYIRLAIMDPDEKVRTRALTVFLETGLRDQEAIESLETALLNTDQSDYANSLAARGLAQIGKPSLATLVEAAGHEEVAVRRAATFGLLKLGTDASSAEPLLRRLAEDPHKGVKTYAEKALAKLEGSS